MYAEIIPIIKLPRKLNFFDYSIPPESQKKLKIGHIAAVSFRRKKIFGAVRRIKNAADAGDKNIKPIERLTDIILPQKFLNILEWAAKDAIVSPAIMLKAALPGIAKEPALYDALERRKKLAVSLDAAARISAALKKYESGGKQFFFYDRGAEETLAFFIKLAEKELRGGRQILFLAPSLADINFFAEYFAHYFEKKLIIFRGGGSRRAKLSDWRRILRGEPCVILGTRPASLLPLNNPSLIFVYNAASNDHKQWDMNPRYDSRRLAEKWAEGGAKLIFSDILPGTEIYAKITDGKITVLGEQPKSQPTVITRSGKNGFFAYPAEEALTEAMNIKKKAVIFLNRAEGDSRYICADCGHQFLCDLCGRPFTIDNGSFLCYNCRVNISAALRCPKCSGTNLKSLSYGAKTVKKILSQEFPKAKIALAAAGGAVPDINFDILITTDYFWKNIAPELNKKNIHSVIMPDFDSYAGRPEYTAKEDALYALWRLYGFAENMRIVIQTASGDRIMFGDPQAVYTDDLAVRQTMGFPPFGKIIKVICKEKDRAALHENAEKLYDKLLSEGFNALPPFEPRQNKRAKNFLRHIVLKEMLDKNLDPLKSLVPDEYQIDVNPISIY